MAQAHNIREIPNSIYNQIMKRKENGEVLDWNTITKRELYFLNLIERVTDKEIGELYGVSLDSCRFKRKRNNILSTWDKNGSKLGQDLERYIWDLLRTSKSKKIEYDLCYRILDAIHPDYNEVAK